ncbi:F0F1 ATP synthase subunit B family protein (plasmid) [Streptomyces sp. HUAS TT11]|uniref:F0F1 ATP synthase subunit B family protein n=1 Tax=Streptomyces sp. HUAS TT11 TaxID=3447508 RepID=UPI003F65A44A
MDLGPLEPHGVELITGLACFGVVFGVFAKFLLPRIEKVMAERDDAIVGTRDRATATRREADGIHAEYKAQLAEAYRELAATRQEAREQGAAIIAAAREEGQRQRDALVADAHAQLNVDRALATAALNENVRYLAVELASRIVGEPLDVFARNSDVIDRFFDELTAEHSKGTAA